MFEGKLIVFLFFKVGQLSLVVSQNNFSKPEDARDISARPEMHP